jgi:hypothetical protein
VKLKEKETEGLPKRGAPPPEHPGPGELEENRRGQETGEHQSRLRLTTGGRECTGLGKVSLCSTYSNHESVQYAEHGEQ